MHNFNETVITIQKAFISNSETGKTTGNIFCSMEIWNLFIEMQKTKTKKKKKKTRKKANKNYFIKNT